MVLIFTTKESIGTPYGLLFIQLSTNDWISYNFIEQEAPHPYLFRVRVYIKSNTTGQILNFDPINFPNLTNQSIWLYKEGYIYSLHFDSKGWNWRRLEGLQETSFFNYQTKTSYRQVCQNYPNSNPYDKELQRLGYTTLQRQLICK